LFRDPGFRFIDQENKEFIADKNKIKKFADFFKTCYQYIQLMPDIVYNSSNELFPAFQDGKILFSSMRHMMATFELISLIAAVDEPIIIPIRNQSGGIDAYSTYTLAVNANTDNPEAAYCFIKLMLDRMIKSVNDIILSWFSVNREILSESIAIAAERAINRPAADKYERGEINQEVIDQCWRLINEIDYCCAVNPYRQSYDELTLFFDAMFPYLEYENDFDRCFDYFQKWVEEALQNKLIYAESDRF